MIRSSAGLSPYLLVGFFLLIASHVPAALAERTDDVVILKNGDRMTGEIKTLQRSELSFKASYMAEAVRLDWHEWQGSVTARKNDLGVSTTLGWKFLTGWLNPESSPARQSA